MGRTVIVIAAAVCGVAVLLAAVYLWVLHIIDSRMKEVAGRQGPGEVLAISKEAGYLGRKPGPMAQIRGNGILVLTRSDLTIYMLKPGSEYGLPLGRVEWIGHPRFFRGKYAGRKMMVVHYCDEAGRKGSMGLWVKRPREWARRIIEARNAAGFNARSFSGGEGIGEDSGHR